MRASLVAVVAVALQLSNQEHYVASKPSPAPSAHTTKHHLAHSGRTATKAFDPMQKLAEMKQKVDNKGKGEPLTDEVFAPVISQIRTIVNDDLTGALGGLEDTIKQSVTDITTCSSEKGFSVAGSAYTAKQGTLNEDKTDAKTKCDASKASTEARDNAGKTLYESTKNSVGCAQTSDVVDVPMDAIGYPLKNIGAWAQTVISQHTEWLNAAQTAGTSGGECTDSKQKKTTSCAQLEQIAAAGKSAYDKCYNAAKGAHDAGALSAAAVTAESPVGMQKKAIERIESLICYISVAITDGSASKIECAPKDGMAVFSCTCSDGGSEIYTEDYSTAVSVQDAPDKDTEWNDKGCSSLAEEGETCTVDADCDQQFVCVSGTCATKPEPTEPGGHGDPCQKNSDCAGGDPGLCGGFTVREDQRGCIFKPSNYDQYCVDDNTKQEFNDRVKACGF